MREGQQELSEGTTSSFTYGVRTFQRPRTKREGRKGSKTSPNNGRSSRTQRRSKDRPYKIIECQLARFGKFPRQSSVQGDRGDSTTTERKHIGRLAGEGDRETCFVERADGRAQGNARLPKTGVPNRVLRWKERGTCGDRGLM